jgi:hypothetical protein
MGSSNELQTKQMQKGMLSGMRQASFLEKGRPTKLNATSLDRHMVAHDVSSLDPTGRARPVYVHLGGE